MINIYYREIRKYHPLPPALEQRLTILIQQGDEQARQTLIEHNLRLVTHIAKTYYHPKVEMLDLIQEGNLGLIEAVDRFNPKMGHRFSTFAVWWIRKRILRYLGKSEDLVRLDTPIKGEEGEALCLGDTIMDEETILGGPACEGQDMQLEQEESRQQMRQRIALLSEREKEVLMMLYGVTEERALTPQEVAERLGVSIRRFYHIRDRALKKLK
jgi:RNA polymerase sporulation-specific sigma factor